MAGRYRHQAGQAPRMAKATIASEASQGHAARLAGLTWRELTREVQGALSEVLTGPDGKPRREAYTLPDGTQATRPVRVWYSPEVLGTLAATDSGYRQKLRQLAAELRRHESALYLGEVRHAKGTPGERQRESLTGEQASRAAKAKEWLDRIGEVLAEAK